MSVTVSLTTGVAGIRARARTAGSARFARLPSRPLRRSHHVSASKDGDGDEKPDEKKFEKNQAEFDSADDWIANWKQGNFPRAKGWKFGDKSDAGTGTFEEVVGQSGDDGETDGSTTYQSEEDADADAEDRSNKYGGDPNDYVYVFAHNMMSPPEDSFACMYLRDVFGTYDVPLLTPNLAPDGDEFTVTSALNALDAAVKEAEVANPDKQIRLIASSMGAYVAAVYASRDVNAAKNAAAEKKRLSKT